MSERRTPDPGRRMVDDHRETVAGATLEEVLTLRDELGDLVKRKEALRREIRFTKRAWFTVWLLTLVLSSVAIYLAGDSRREVSHQAEMARRTAIDARKQSREACQRTKQFGPALANTYEKYRILTPEQVKAYRDTLPTACP